MKKSGLGRGLSSLLQENLDTDSNKVYELSVFDIEPNPSQPRKTFSEDGLNTLAASISEVGVLSPILVRQKENGLYEIIAGERRWRASKLAGKKKIPAIIKDYESRKMMEIALIENLQREDLNPLEEALGYQTLKDRFGFTQEEIAKRISKSRSTVANIMRILNLPEFVLKEIKNGKVSLGHAKAISSLETDEAKKLLLYEIVKNEISVREAEEMAKKLSSKKRTNLIKKPLRKNPNITEVENRLTAHFGTKVQIKSGKIKSKIEIEYYSQEDLQRIVDKLI